MNSKLFVLISFLCLLSLVVQAEEYPKNSISVKGGYAVPRGAYFSASYFRSVGFLDIGSSFVYANSFLDDDVFFAANNVSGVYHEPKHISGSIYSGLMLNLQVSSTAFTSFESKHRISFAVGLGAVNTVEIWTGVGFNPEPYWMNVASSVKSIAFGQHASITYSYRLQKVELGVFCDALKTLDDAYLGIGLLCSIPF